MAEVSKRMKTGGRAYLKLAPLAALVLSGLFLVRLTPLAEYTTWEGISRVIGMLQGSVWAPVLFVMLYAGATALAIPGTILTLAGGALFGFFWGTVLNSIAANIGANLAFLGARVLGRGGIEQLFDARVDPDELDDRAQEMPEELARLRGLADAYLQMRPPWGESPTREIEELELNQLRALGYAIP